MEIIPAILAKDFEELREHISQVIGLAKIVQIDICDGIFVSSKSWPYPEDINFAKIMAEEEGLPFWEEVDFELDLMVQDARFSFDKFIKLGAKRLIFHAEAEDLGELNEFIEAIDPYTRESIQIGIAINTTTSIEKLAQLIFHIDFVQCMGIEHIGQQGQPFDERVLDQIKALKILYPELEISVDGGVNLITAPHLLKAGANRLVVGSALFKSDDIEETLREFKNLK